MRKEISPPPILRSALLAGFVAAASFAASDASAATRTATEAFATNAAARAAAASTNALAAVAHTGDYADLDNTPDIIPADTYIRNPATGLYHLLTAELNEDGELTISLDPEGVER